MNLQENIQRIKSMMEILSEENSNSVEYVKNKINLKNNNTEKTHIGSMSELKKNVEYMLEFYIKVGDKYYDKKNYENKKEDEKIENVSSLISLVGFFKSSMESVRFDAELNNKWEGNVIKIYDEIIDILNKFFEPKIYQDTSVNHSEKGWDYYTGIHCKRINPKSPPCQK